jgi:GNAT superfamily N-acetyltransferase
MASFTAAPSSYASIITPTVTNLPPPPFPSTHPSSSLGDLTTTLFSPSSLLSSPYLDPIYHLINAAFAGSHTVGSVEHLPRDLIRLGNPQQLVEEVGGDGFTIVVFASNAYTKGEPEKRPIATASAKPWKENAGERAVGSETNRLFKRKTRSTPSVSTSNNLSNNVPQWEILIMVVDLAHRNRGLATTLIDTVVQEIKRRVFPCPSPAPTSGEKQEQDQKIVLMLTTMKEKSEGYYQKRGFVTTQERRFAKGEVGSRDGFCVVEMERVY